MAAPTCTRMFTNLANTFLNKKQLWNSLNSTRLLHTNIQSKIHNKTITQLSTLAFGACRSCRFTTNAKSDTENESSIKKLLSKWTNKFTESGIDEPDLSIKHILAHILGRKQITCLEEGKTKDTVLYSDQLEKLEQLCNCRLARMPVQYIIGEWDFHNITLKVTPPVLIPRPETEQLVDLVLEEVKNNKDNDITFADIGCGSGCISLALLNANSQMRGVAVDTSPAACQLTRQNSQLLRLSDRLVVIQNTLKNDGSFPNWNCEQKFDILVSNPPYIPRNYIPKLQPEIFLYEDVKAYDGGTDGLRIVKPLLIFASKVVKNGGKIFIEMDAGSIPILIDWLKDASLPNLQVCAIHKDFAKRDRFVEIVNRQ